MNDARPVLAETSLPRPQPQPEPVDRRNWIAGLEKGLAILQVFDVDHDRLSATEAAKLAGMTRSSARRHLMMLRYLGYVATDGRSFWLQPRVLRLGGAYLQSARFPRAVQPVLQRLTAVTGESAFASVLDGQELVYVARNVPTRNVSAAFVSGTRVSPFVTSAGIALVATLARAEADAMLERYEPVPHTPSTVLCRDELARCVERSRRLGYCMVEQQLEPGVRGLAMPLRNHRAEVIGAVSVSCRSADESDRASLLRLLPALQQVVADFRFAQ